MEEEKKELEAQNILPEDEFVIGKGFAIEPIEEMQEQDAKEFEESVKPQKTKKKSKGIVRSLIRIFLILIISGGLAFGILYAGMDYLGISFGGEKEISVEIKSGASVKQIAEQLKEEGVIKIPTLFRLYAKLKHYDSNFKDGLHRFNTEDGYAEISSILSVDGKKADQVKVVLPEGSAIDDMAKKLEEAGVCTAEDFINEVQHGKFSYDFIKEIPEQKVYYRLEGYLFPDTYYFYCYDSKECAHLAVDKMLGETSKNLTKELMETVQKSGHTVHEILTMASIIELESSGDHSEMANVSAVFWNRLKSTEFTKLQSSPTTKYPYGSGRYDTYQSEGLPPGPLCSPGLNAIKAAVEPTANFDYYYFVTDAKMKFYYNKTLAEHNRTIARLKKENNWIGDR